jgi:hypothetical protein
VYTPIVHKLQHDRSQDDGEGNERYYLISTVQVRVDLHNAPVLVRILTSSIVYSSASDTSLKRVIADLAKGVEALEVAHEAIATHLVCFARRLRGTRM